MSGSLGVGESQFHLPSGISGRDSVGWNIGSDDASCGDDGATAYGDPRQHDGAVANPDIVSDDNLQSLARTGIVGIPDPRCVPNGPPHASVIVVVTANE